MSSNRNIGIFICTRNSVGDLSELLDSIFSLCHDPSNISVWVGYDEDDKETEKFAHNVEHDINFFVNSNKSEKCLYCNEYYVNRHRDVINPMIEMSDTDYYWVLNDDNRILTQDFDSIIIDTIEEFLSKKSDRILLGMVDVKFVRNGKWMSHLPTDQYNLVSLGTDYSCYPLVTKETVDVIGYFLPPDLPNDGADIVLGQGFGISSYSRKLKLPVSVRDEVKGFGEERIDPEKFFGRQENGSVKYFVNDYLELLEKNGQKCHHRSANIDMSSTMHNEPIKIASKLNNAFPDITRETTRPITFDLSITYLCNSCNRYYSEPFYMHNMITTCPNCKSTCWIDMDERMVRAVQDTKIKVTNVGRYFLLEEPEKKELDEIHRRSK